MADRDTNLGTRLGFPALMLGGAGLAVGLPGVRTASFLALTARQLAEHDYPTIPTTELSLKLAAKVAVDEAVRALMLGMSDAPSRSQSHRILREVTDALELYEDRGWLARPEGFHREPPPLRRPRMVRRRAAGVDYEHLAFQSAYRPRTGEPGRDRWLAMQENRTCHAWVLRHRQGPDRPWLISIPGFRMGTPAIDLSGLRADHYHFDLGFNVLIPVLPLHGPRAIGRRSGDGFISADAMNTVHAEAQAMWDLRRMLGWIRHEGTSGVGVWGVSLGGYNTALLASLEEDLACAVAGIPASCFADLLDLHLPAPLRWLGGKLGVPWNDIRRLVKVVSPLSIQPRVAHERRFMFAGLADRLVPPQHVHELWQHWGRPRIAWYQGSHLSFRWENDVRSLMHEALRETGLLAPTAKAATNRSRAVA